MQCAVRPLVCCGPDTAKLFVHVMFSGRTKHDQSLLQHANFYSPRWITRQTTCCVLPPQKPNRSFHILV